MMFSIKVIGNILMCDDKDAVSIIDPIKMKMIAKIPVPKEKCYL
jgi:hypothetical protein